ncbi:c-type cytochrome biogenesis protein CcmI [Colwellia sp. M166]|uniref:c-type cytochrome biogenesis protein CcmI n=1 Tax=Colwellia sp. M166 TaxID=2583805 RepID=UPI00211DA972|nr:c-type cytochrome biogenesis protein CcmI [Colwellia sp. M166]UUO24675.1 c-type cytochrome biogenesis protein CcmI [Colwellia sp. M166]|tara:strand:+ start:16091 stop:17353 length:1263 start_codon:yes stop_codon:yes gene_type:complete
MTTFWLAILLLIVIALLIVWRIFTAANNAIGAENGNIRQETNVTLYHEHLSQLEHDLAEGSIEQDSFLQLKAELDKTLLQDANSSENNITEQQQKSWLWPVGIAFAIVSLSFYSYMILGAYPQLNSPAALNESDAHSELSPEQMLAYRLQQLQQEIANDPTNSQALFSLGQAYISVGEFDNAIEAFDGVITQVGEHAELLGPKAQAMYYKNNQVINDDIQLVIDKALALDSLDASTNILLGMDSFSNRDFAKAVKYWETVLNSDRPGISKQALIGAVEEAKNQLRMSSDGGALTETAQGVDPTLPRLNVNVSLASNVQKALMNSEDKTVFIYAIAADGPRMPLAAVKIKASDLPLSIVLDDKQAMTPQMRLSSVDKVHIYAVVSMQGNVGIKPGDFKVEVLDIDVMEKSPINMQISAQVP